MGLLLYLRLLRAGFVLAREGAFSLIDTENLPGSARFLIWSARTIERGSVRKTGRVDRLSKALNRLGPTYVKFGQALATRSDIVGPAVASDLSQLHDAMMPFDQKLVPDLLSKAFGKRAADFVEISDPVAAASIAQVHKAKLVGENGEQEIVAIKLLRPGIEKRFRRDIESFFAGARLLERIAPDLKRLKPVAVIKILDHSARKELDLRFEAAAISEFSENTINDAGFDVPQVKWTHLSQRVLTTSWIEGIAIRDIKALDAANIDRKKLASDLMQNFLRHAIRDGLFHADMHPGNLFADPKTGGILAVDFGIMGRIGKREQRFLAEIIYGFLTRNYARVAKLHFAIGYVPADQSVDDFALALRMIGEPMHGRKASEISMADVLGQLLSVTELFNMQTRPELILLQKNMVLVEGVGRMLDPDLDIWSVSEPIVTDWIKREAGPVGKLVEARDNIESLFDAVAAVPDLVKRADRLLEFHEEQMQKHQNGTGRLAIWGLGLLIVLLVLFIWAAI